jgi:16S rRNA (guanine966-N2)-methyltransferase
MRILSGKYKGKLIKFPHLEQVAVVLTRARSTIFDILRTRIKHNPSVLDCFAGSGILGIEALSQLGGNAVFFEYDKKVSEMLIKNLLNLGLFLQSKVHCINSLRPVQAITAADLIFVDPPYKSSYIIPDVIKKLEKRDWIKENTIIVIKTSLQEKITLPLDYVLWREKKCGNNLISFFQYQKPESQNDEI